MIEKKIHYCWFGKNPIPEKDLTCIESWKKYCPDYEIIQWNEENYDINKCLFMKQAYEAKKWGFVPDYARLDIIYNEGGIYLDTDVEIIKSLDELLQFDAFMGFENDKNVALGLGFGACRNNAVIKRMMEQYEEMNFINDDGSFNTIASPFFSSQIMREYGLKMNGQTQEVYGIKVFSREYFAPLSYKTNRLNITNNTYSIHWFNASWQTDEQKNIIRCVQKINRIFGEKMGGRINRIVCAFLSLKKEGISHYINRKVKSTRVKH